MHTCGGGGMEHKHVWRMRHRTCTRGGGEAWNINTCGGGGMEHKHVWMMRHGTQTRVLDKVFSIATSGKSLQKATAASIGV